MFLITVREDGQQEPITATDDGDRAEAFCKRKNDLTTEEVSYEYRVVPDLDDLEDNQLTQTIHDPRND